MGVLKDLGTSEVVAVDKRTGYPMDRYGHLLRSLDEHDGSLVEGWNKAGTKLYNQTNPYGFLSYVVGSGDDFHCFDFKVINCGPLGDFIILHGTINSETGHFIDGANYDVMPIRTEAERKAALAKACEMVSEAEEWCLLNQVRHTRKGWNADPQHFLRDVASELWSWKFEGFSHREMRFGGKRVNQLVAELLKGG